MNLVVAADRPTPILWRRASALASPTDVPVSTLPARGMAPVRASIASRSVVLPLWKGPTSAMHRGPRGLLTSCPIAASSSGARPLIGSAGANAHPTLAIWQDGKTSLRCILAQRPCHRDASLATASLRTYGSRECANDGESLLRYLPGRSSRLS